MKVVVEFTNDAHTKARITVMPSRLARLFGACSKAGDAERVAGYWVWSTTLSHIRHTAGGERIIAALELQDVRPLPVALVRGER